MSLSINTNTSAISAAYNLDQSNAKLQQALAELSSGSKIVNPSDDAGGLAVSMRMNATIADTNAANTNVANGHSFLQTQDGSLNVAASILTRMSELETMANDPTKNAGDVANYNAEFTALQGQLTDLTQAPSTVSACSNPAVQHAERRHLCRWLADADHHAGRPCRADLGDHRGSGLASVTLSQRSLRR